jgi:hypothetical protein
MTSLKKIGQNIELQDSQGGYNYTNLMVCRKTTNLSVCNYYIKANTFVISPKTSISL